MESLSTRGTVLAVAQDLVQSRGLNGFSFRDIATQIGIKSASVHYHFPTKVDLCIALLTENRVLLKAALSRITKTEQTSHAKLVAYGKLFSATLSNGNQMCICGMVAADSTKLSPGILHLLQQLIEDHEVWLESVLSQGRHDGEFKFAGTPKAEAQVLFGAFEGLMLISKVWSDPLKFDHLIRQLLTRLT